jgi:glycine cleavage system regulatory protein
MVGSLLARRGTNLSGLSSNASRFWSKARSVPAKYPLAFGVVLSGFKTSFSDLLVQKVVERKEKIDWRRNAAFAAFGFVYLGGVQYTLYVPIFGRLFPNAAKFAAKPLRQKVKDVRGLCNLGLQTFLDQCVHHPFMYFPAFYITKELVMGGKDGGKPDISRVLTDYRNNMKEDLIALWKIWVPCTVVNFAFMPMHLRIPFAAGVSLLWTCVLSTMRGGDAIHGDDMVGGQVTQATYQIFMEGLDAFNTTPVEMDRNLAHVSISAAGKDRPGMVAQLASHVASRGGNVTHSKMVRLGEEFIIQMHVAVPQHESNAFFDSLKSSDLKELNIQPTRLNRRQTNHKTKAVMGMKIHCVGDDRTGILADVTNRIASKGMSLEDVSTSIRKGALGQREFVIDVLASSPNIQDKDNLDQYIADITSMETDLQLSHLDIRVHTA